MMNWIVYLFASGATFFVGSIIIIVAIAACRLRPQLSRRLVPTLVACGLILVVMSATPLPIWFLAAAVASTIAWTVLNGIPAQTPDRRQLAASVAVALWWSAGIVHELQYQRLPTVSPSAAQRIYLIGDSLSAHDAGASTDAWPTRLAKNHHVEIVNLARPGATVANALERAAAVDLGPGIVLLEIGGNDLLGSTSADAFAENLEKLLQRVQGKGRQIVMFELPLFPFRGEFGRIQRRLASKYGALLVPKRILISVLTGPGATLDTIHLSAAGHERMAETVWTIIEPAYNRH